MHLNMYAYYICECTHHLCTCIYTLTDMLEVRVYIRICLLIMYMNVHKIHAHVFTRIQMCWRFVYTFEYVCVSYI